MPISTQMPQTQAPFVTLNDGRITSEWLYVLQILWANGGGGGGGTGLYAGNIGFVTDLRDTTSSTRGDTTSYVVQNYDTLGDHGGGLFYLDSDDTTSDDNGGTIIVDADGNRWKRIFSGAVSVEWWGAKGDAITDDTAAFQAALDNYVDVFVPAGDFLITSLDMGDQQGRKFRGAGSLATTLYSNAGDGPMILVTETLYYMEISGFYLERMGTAVDGDFGIETRLILSAATIRDVSSNHQFIGFVLRAADSGFVNQCVAAANVSDGFYFSNWTTGPGAGQVQWVLSDNFSSANGQHGYHVASTGSGPAQISVGTWSTLQTFANTGHGVAIHGLPGQPIQGIRLQGGFFGEDGASEIYLDSHGGGHVIDPAYLELCGRTATGPTLSTPPSLVGSGMEFTANNRNVDVACRVSNGHSYDGIISSADFVTITGGAYQNNGLSANISRSNGIYIYAGQSVAISGCRLGNLTGNTSQKFGLASNVDCIAMAACDLRFNTLSWYAFSGGLTVSQIAGCLPGEANTFSIPGDLTVGSLHVTGDAAFGGDVFMDGGGTFYNNTGGIVGLNIQALANLYGVNAVLSGDVDTQTLHVNGESAFFGAINANTVTGYFDGVVTNNLNVAGTSYFGNLTADYVTANVDLISNGQLHVAGAAAMAGGLTITNGGLNLTAGVPGNGITADNLTVRVSAGVGTNATGVAGQLRVQTDIVALNQLHVIGQSAFSADMNLTGANTFYANSGAVVGQTVQALGTVYGHHGDFSTGNVYGAVFQGGSFNGTTGTFSGNLSGANISGASLTTSSNATIGGNLNVTGASGFSGALNAPGQTFYGASVVVDVASVAPGAIYGPGGVPYTFP